MLLTKYKINRWLNFKGHRLANPMLHQIIKIVHIPLQIYINTFRFHSTEYFILLYDFSFFIVNTLRWFAVSVFMYISNWNSNKTVTMELIFVWKRNPMWQKQKCDFSISSELNQAWEDCRSTQSTRNSKIKSLVRWENRLKIVTFKMQSDVICLSSFSYTQWL